VLALIGMTTHPSKISSVKLVNDLDFDEEVVQAAIPVFIDVSAAWCAPCKAAKPVVEELARRYGDRLKVVEVDGGESADVAARLQVRGFPTFVGMIDGNVVERIAGFSGSKALDAMANRLLSHVAVRT
jgi:thioredoxin 1